MDKVVFFTKQHLLGIYKPKAAISFCSLWFTLVIKYRFSLSICAESDGHPKDEPDFWISFKFHELLTILTD